MMLILAAHPLELEAFTSRLDEDLSMRTVGVGLVAASAGSEAVFRELKPSTAVLVGSVGASDATPIGTLVLARETHLFDSALVRGEAELPPIVGQQASFDEALTRGFATANPAALTGSIATTLGITVNSTLATTLYSKSQPQYENLEALAVAQAAIRHGVRLVGLFGVTNRIGPTGRQEWSNSHGPVASEVAEAFYRWWSAGQPGQE